MTELKNSYTAPEPTPEQFANAQEKGFDPYDCAGSLPMWDCAPNDTLAAPSTIHDEMTVRGGSLDDAKQVADNFKRDCIICASACSGDIRADFELAKAKLFSAVVDFCISQYWSTEDRNNAVTRMQGTLNIIDAQQWINACAMHIEVEIPYPGVGTGNYKI